MNNWTQEQLAELPRRGDFRLRGLAMTRLEAFTDAAFAFATTMLVISSSGIPGSVDDLVKALKDIPAFLAAFAAIASFWHAHRQWSRRFGLEDGASTLLSLGLVFVMMVFVYPLKMVFSALFAWISNGWLPTTFVLGGAVNLPTLFVIYGLGFMAQTGLIAVLYWRALKAGSRLALDGVERLKTREDIVSFSVLAATGLVSSLWAGLLPAELGVWAGFIYCTLPITMPVVAIRFARKVEKLKEA
jgi:hypothetical protein